MTKLLPVAMTILLTGCCCNSNLTDRKSQLITYYQTGKYERDVASVTAAAERFIAKRITSAQTNLAIVLDIDETALSDWAYMKGIDFGFEQEHFDNWIGQADAPAIRPVLTLFKTAQRLGLKTFFITGRKEHLRQATERNLNAVGYNGFSGLFMRPEAGPKMSTADFKKSIRAKLTSDGCVIIVNVGDQKSDLAGGFAERTFKIPNPFYSAD